MNQLGKNLVLALCIVAALLVILGLKRKLAGDGEATLLSQPSGDLKITRPEPAKGSPRPRVLQAKPVTQHERAILSPTNSHFADSETDRSPASGVPIAPLPIPVPSPRPLDAPDLVPVSEPMASPPTANFGGRVPESTHVPEATPLVESPTGHAAGPLPEFVLTEPEDSFWTISERVYGSGVYYRALFRHNEAKVLRPDQLRAGVQVETPSLDVLRDRYPADFPQDPSSTP